MERERKGEGGREDNFSSCVWILEKRKVYMKAQIKEMEESPQSSHSTFTEYFALEDRRNCCISRPIIPKSIYQQVL